LAISGGQGWGGAAEDEVDGAEDAIAAAEDEAADATELADVDAEPLADGFARATGADAEDNIPTESGAS
jgi:hypothetical protein